MINRQPHSELTAIVHQHSPIFTNYKPKIIGIAHYCINLNNDVYEFAILSHQLAALSQRPHWSYAILHCHQIGTAALRGASVGHVAQDVRRLASEVAWQWRAASAYLWLL